MILTGQTTNKVRRGRAFVFALLAISGGLLSNLANAACPIDVSVSQPRDDAEEAISSGIMDRWSSDLELINDFGTDQVVGLLFRSLAIAQGDTITSADITFDADESQSGTTDLTFHAEDIDNPAIFTDSNGDITDRTTTSASVDWNSVPAWTAATTYTTPDLAAIIQEVVNRPGWVSGNNLVVIVSGTSGSKRVAESEDGNGAPAALHIECGAATPAVTSAVAEISPNDVTTSSTANAFSYDIQATISGGDTGVNRVAITVPAAFGAPTITGVQVGGVGVAYTNNTSGNAISVDLTTKVTASSKITVLFSADAPTSQDLTGVNFISTVDDSGTGDAAQSTTMGDGDGDAGDLNSWKVTTTDAAATPAVTSAVAEISPNDVTTSSTANAFSYDIQATISGGDTGVNRVAITVPVEFTVPALPVSDVLVNDVSVGFTDNSSGNAISVDLTAKVTASSKITVLFTSDAPTTQDTIGVNFISTVDDTGTGDAAQATTEGNGDGDAGDADSWKVTTTDATCIAMMIVGDAVSPSASDQSIASYLVGNGVAVFYADDNDSTATFNSIISTNSITSVYISESSSSTALNTKALGLTTGIVTANNSSWTYMLLGSPQLGSSGGTDINVVDNTHYITSPFATGSLTIYTSSGGRGYTQNPGSGGQVLAQYPAFATKSMILAYDTGTQLEDTSLAPARRVGLFTDDLYSLWNASAQTLTLRSLQWAGNCSGATSTSAVTSAVAEISPNDVTTSSTANAFSYDIQATISGGDTGVNRVTITVPGSFGAPTVTDVLVNDVSVAKTDNTSGNAISIDLTAKVTASSKITMLFSADAPTTQDLTGVNFISTVDDSGTGDAAQSTTEGNGDGNAGDANSWKVTTTDAAATPAVTSAVAEISPNDVTTSSTANAFSYDIQATISGGDTGVNRVTITVPGSFGAPTVTDVLVDDVSVAKTDNTSGNAISIDLTAKVTASSKITVLFSADAPTTQDATGVNFMSTVDDSGTGDAAQSTTEGDGDGNAGDANSWKVTTTDAAGSCSVSVSISALPDDAEETISTGNMMRWGADLEMITDTPGDQTVGLRFLGLAIDQGATVSSADVTFTADQFNNDTTNLTFHAEDSDDAPAFSDTNFDISSRTKTSASVAWNTVAAWTGGNTYTTPDLSAIIQEVVNRTNWVSGNDLVVIVTGTSGSRREAESADKSGGTPALLQVTCGAASPAVTSAVAEISPNDVTTSSTANAFSYDIQATISGGDTGVNRVTITVPGSFGAPTVTDVLVDDVSVAKTDNTSGNAISIDLTAKVTASSKITVLFSADAPTTQDLTGVNFTSTVDDSATGDAAQATTEGNGDGNAGDANSWKVTTTNAPGGSCDVDTTGTYIEGENYVPPLVAGTGPGTFLVQSSLAGYNPTGYLISSGSSTVTPPENERADYTVNFTTTGTYYVWQRGYGVDGGSDSIFFGLDGTWAGALNDNGTRNQWIWTNSVQTTGNTINVATTGQHTINLWVREANHGLDGIYITQNSGAIPGGTAIGIPTGATVIDPNTCGATTAVTSAVAEISPNDVTTSSTANAFSYDIQATISGGDTGVNRVAITAPVEFTVQALPVSDVLVDDVSVAYTDNSSGNAISVDLTAKVTASSKITVLFSADAPTTEDLTGVNFISTVDDSGTGDAAQSTTEGNGDGDAGDANSWKVTTTDATGVNYRSIGTNAATLYSTGDASITSGTTTVTFGTGASLPLPTVEGAVGQGDKLVIAGETFFILSRDSATQATVQQAAASTHSSAAYTISRAYNKLQDWEDDCAVVPGCLPTSSGGRGGDLVADDRYEIGVAYNDASSGAFIDNDSDDRVVNIAGSTVDATHHRDLTVAVGQRHNGTAGTGALVDGQTTTAYPIQVRESNTRVDWFEVKNGYSTTDGGSSSLYVGDGSNTVTNVMLEYFLVYDYAYTGKWNAGARPNSNGGTNSFTIRNSIFYNGNYAVRSAQTIDSVTVENCTSYNMSRDGYQSNSGGVLSVTNSIAILSGAADFSAGITGNYNLDADGSSAPGANSLHGKTAANQFVSITSGSEDLHLKAGADAINAGSDLSGSFTGDIDGDTRPIAGAWEIGADETSAAGLGAVTAAVAEISPNDVTTNFGTYGFSYDINATIGATDSGVDRVAITVPGSFSVGASPVSNVLVDGVSVAFTDNTVANAISVDLTSKVTASSRITVRFDAGAPTTQDLTGVDFLSSVDDSATSYTAQATTEGNGDGDTGDLDSWTVTTTDLVSGGGACLAIDGTVSTGSTLTNTMTIPHTTSGANRLLLVGVSIDNSQNEEVVNPAGVTYNGVALTRVGFENHVGGNDSRVELWSLVAPATGTNNVVITFTADLARSAVAGVMTFTGVDQTTPFGTLVTNNATSTAASINVSSAVGELVIGVMAAEDPTSVTTDAPATERWNLSETDGIQGEGFGAAATELGAASVNIGWTLGVSQNWAALGVPIRPAASCGGSTDHFSIVDNGTSNNCQAKSVTIAAHDSGHAVNSGFTGFVSLSTSSSNGEWSIISGSGTLNSSGSGNATYIYDAADSGSVELGLLNPVVETLNVNVTDGTTSEDPTEDPDLTFQSTNQPAVTLQETITDSTTGSSLNMPAIAGGTDMTYVLMVGSKENGDITGVAGGGLTWTVREEQCGTTSKSRIELWTAQGSPGSSFQVSMSSPKPMAAVLGRYSGVASFGSTSSANPDGVNGSCSAGNKTSPAEISLTSTVNGSVHIIGTNSHDKSVTSVTGGYTLVGFDGNVGEKYPLYVYHDSFDPATASTFQATMSGATWWSSAGIVLEPTTVSTCGTGSVDHFSISHDGTGINCQAETVTIAAHNSNHTVMTNYAGIAELSTTTSHGDWSLITGSGWASNSGRGAGSYAFDFADAGVVILGLKDTFVETTNIDTTNGFSTEDVTEDPNLVFARAGFNFLADGTMNTIGTQIGGKASDVAPGAQTLELQAVKTSDDTGACEAALTGTTTIELGFECENPSSCTASQVAIGGTNLPASADNAVLSYSGLSLDFGNSTDSTATFTLSYPDVGQVRLHARTRIMPSGEAMLGASNQFVVRPFALQVTATGNPAATGPAGGVFTSAGTDFTATVNAVLWDAADDLDANGIADSHDDSNPANNADLSDNLIALNYGQETAVEQVLLTATLDQPAGGANPGLAGGTSINAFTLGSGTTSTVRYNEVGIIEVSAAIADNDYLGIGATESAKITSKSGYVGRFNPAQYAVTASSIVPACSATFTYARQTFTGSMTVEAQAGAAGGNVRTTNYRAGFVTLDPATELTFVNDQTAAAYDAKTITFTEDFDSVSTGEAVLALQFRWDMPEQAPATSVVQNTAVTDEVTTLSAAPVNIGSSLTRYGRAAFGSATGSELVNLGVPLRTEYYVSANTGYVTNTDDFCSSGATLSFSNFAGNLAAGETCVEDTGSPGTSGAGCAVAGPVAQRYDAPPIAGEFNLFLDAPGAGNDGSATVDANVPDWLEFDWDTGVPGLEDPTGRVTFGIYGGDKNQVYRRELY